MRRASNGGAWLCTRHVSSTSPAPAGRPRCRRSTATEKTRRAYGIDVGQFAVWASRAGVEPGGVTPRTLRRYAAALSRRGAAASTVARKLASLRALFRALREAGTVEQNPAELLSAPKRPRNLPKTLRPDEVSRLLDRIPAATPLELRDRALLELAYATGLRAEELVSLDTGSVDFDAEEARVEGKGQKTRVVPLGEHALGALGRYLDRGRPALASGDGNPALFLKRISSRRWRRSPSPAGACPRRTCAGACASGPGTRRWRAGCHRTGCATRSPPICWKEGPICGPFRSFWATPASPRRRFTLE